MRYTADVYILIAMLLVLLMIWGWMMAAPPVSQRPLAAPLAILWHPVAPITDWTPHTSTVLR